MSLNCNEIDVILAELNLAGSFIQEIIQPSYDMLALMTYKTGSAKTIIICTAPGACRINETQKKITRNDRPLRFMELLNARIRGARIVRCEHLDHNHIIRFTLSHADETLLLFVRLWSSAANIILRDQSLTIIDALYRRPAKNEISGAPFALPDAPLLTAQELSRWQARTDDDSARAYAAAHPDAPPLTFNQKIDHWYSEYAQALSREALLARAEKWYTATMAKRRAALMHLKEKHASFEHAEQYRHQADLILSYAHEIVTGRTYVECTDYETGNRVRIMLDPQKDAPENARDYYDRYRKAARGRQDLAHDIALAETQLAALEKTYKALQQEQNPVRMEQLLRRATVPKQHLKKKQPGLLYQKAGWQILVGRTADENDELLRHHVRGSDWWLHTRDTPGGYVFIMHRPGKTVPLDILLDAGNLAVYHSKARKAATADLYYTQAKYLRRVKNGPKGLVIPSHEKNLTITLDRERLLRLDALHKEHETIGEIP